MSRPGRVVLEAGGGIVRNPPAYELLLRHYRTIWLRASPREHLERVRAQGDLRPMRGFDRALEHVERLLAEREALYARADHAVDTSGRDVESCLAELLELARPVLIPVEAAESAPERQDAGERRTDGGS